MILIRVLMETFAVIMYLSYYYSVNYSMVLNNSLMFAIKAVGNIFKNWYYQGFVLES